MTRTTFPNTHSTGSLLGMQKSETVTPLSNDERSLVTAVILAGGKGRRMGGEDKGLVQLAGRSMVEHVLTCIAPQVGQVIIVANRNRTAYERLGHPVFQDELDGFQGPLAGFVTALAQINTPLLLTLPCVSPVPPPDLAVRLYRALQEERADIAMANDGERTHPVFSLLRRELLPSLQDFLAAGNRRIDQWFERHRYISVGFSDEADAFLNVNSPEEHAEFERHLLKKR